MIVARHKVPGTAPPQESRPVGYGMIVQVYASIRTFEAAFLRRHDAHFGEKYLWDRLRPIIPYPPGRLLGMASSQALRARLRSCCPSGTKYISAPKL